MRKQFLIIDGNSIGHRAQNTGKSKLTVGQMEVTAIFHFFRTMRSFACKYSMATPVVLWDGLSWRAQRHVKYKESRKKEDTQYQKEQAESRRSYQQQRPLIQRGLGYLGVTQVQAQNMEADDLAAIMTDLYSSQGSLVTLVSEDRDWMQLVKEGTALERPMTKDRITAMNFEEKTGVPTAANFVEMKAMMGDKSDDVEPIGGIGEKRAAELVKTYGSFNRFLEEVMIHKTIDPETLPKYLRDLVNNEEKALAFAFNMSLVDLRHPSRPAVEGLAINHGSPNADHFRQFCEILAFRDFTADLENWLSVFPVGRAALHAASIQA